jgi:hypothetical protein
MLHSKVSNCNMLQIKRSVRLRARPEKGSGNMPHNVKLAIAILITTTALIHSTTCATEQEMKLTVKALPVAKAKFHRYDNLRSGRIKTERGWNTTDFALSLYNPNLKPVTVTMKMIADDTNFVYNNYVGKGTWTRKLTLKPDDGDTANVYCGLFPPGNPAWPVPVESYWTGHMELSSDDPFYVYVLPCTPQVEGPDATMAVRKGWLLWSNEVKGTWDTQWNVFLFPYSNYWQNDPDWLGGWYSRLIIVNHGNQPVTYRINHKGFSVYGDRTSQTHPQVKVSYGTDVADVTLAPGEKADLRLADVFGWRQDNFSSKMEGRVWVQPTPLGASATSEVNLYILPGRVTFESLKEKEKKALSDETGKVIESK